jgi:hypothetical protein
VVLHGGPGRSTLVTDSVSLDARRLRVAAVLNRFPIL